MGKAGDIGDVIRLKGEYLYNVQAIDGFSDDATGESPPQKEFEKTFRYSKDGVTFSEWASLTLTNLQNISLAQDDTLYIEYAYKRIGTDSSGILEVSEVTLSVSYFSYISKEQYEKSFFDDVARWYDAGAITWSLTVLRKVVGKGILPDFLNKKSEDSISLWRSITDFFSWIINHARSVVNFSSDENLLRKFLDNRGYFHAEDDTLAMLNDARKNLYNRMSRRGTQEHKDQEIKNLLDNDFPREYIFELSQRHKIGWNVGNSSPLYRGFESHVPFVKGYEKSVDVIDLSKYPLENDQYISISDDSGLSVMLISAVAAGSRSGINFPNGFDGAKAIPVSPDLSFQVYASIKVSDPTTNITFGVQGFDVNGGSLGLIEANTGISKSNFFEDANLPQAGQYYKIRGIVFEEGYAPPAHVPAGALEMEFGGTHLELPPEVVYVMPFLYVDNTGGGSVTGDIRIHNFAFTYLSSDQSDSFVGISNLMRSYFSNNKGKVTDEKFEDFVERLYKPYNSHVFFTPVPSRKIEAPLRIASPTNLQASPDDGAIDASVASHPITVDNYNWYLDGSLVATTPDGTPNYRFTGLINEQTYRVGCSVTVGGVESAVVDWVSHIYDTSDLGHPDVVVGGHNNYKSQSFFFSGSFNRTYFTWRDNTGTSGQWIFYYDHDSGVISNSVKIADVSTGDVYPQGTISVDSSGVLWFAVEDTHNGIIKVFKSTNPEDISSWSLSGTISGPHAYPKIWINDQDHIFIITRTNHDKVTISKSVDGVNFSQNILFDAGEGGSGSSRWAYNTILSSRKDQGLHIVINLQDRTAGLSDDPYPDCFYFYTEDGVNIKNINAYKNYQSGQVLRDISTSGALSQLDVESDFSILLGANNEYKWVRGGSVSPTGEPIMRVILGVEGNSPEIDSWSLARWSAGTWGFTDISSIVVLTDVPLSGTTGTADIGALEVINDNIIQAYAYEQVGANREITVYRSSDGGASWGVWEYLTRESNFEISTGRIAITYNYFDEPQTKLYWSYQNNLPTSSDPRTNIHLPADIIPVQTSFTSIDDAFLEDLNPDTNLGSTQNVLVRDDGFAIRQPMLKFDISGLSVTVSSASLELTLSNDNGFNVTLRTHPPIDKGYVWDEGTITWNKYYVVDGEGIAANLDSGTTLSGSEVAGDIISFDITNYLNERINAGASFITIFIISESAVTGSIFFAAKENSTYSGPSLSITP